MHNTEMDVGSSFDLAEQLLRLQEDDMIIEYDVSAMDVMAQQDLVTRIVDAVASSATSVNDSDIYQCMLSCIKSVSNLPNHLAHRLLDTILSGMNATIEEVVELDSSQWAAWTEPLERYAFLLQWLVELLEKHRELFGKSEKGINKRAGSSSTLSTAFRDSGEGSWTWASSLPVVLRLFSKTLRTVPERMWTSKASRDTFISRCILRPVMLCQENEVYLKDTAIKLGIFRVVCLAVKLHGQGLNVQTSISQALQYYEHLAEPMAELLGAMRTEFDVEVLGEDVLRDFAAKSFTSLDSKGPRSYARFLVRMTELNPRSVLKLMSLLQRQQESESYPIRNAMVEVHGLLIKYLATSEDDVDAALNSKAGQLDTDDDGDDTRNAREKQMDVLFERLFERFLDLTTFVRTKAIQVCGRLCDLAVRLPTQRLRMTSLAVQSLEDKSSNVRRNAIALLVKLVLTHPYGVMHGGELNADAWTQRRDVVRSELEKAEERLAFPVTEEGEADAGIDGEDQDQGDEDMSGRMSSRSGKPRRSELDLDALAATQQSMTHAEHEKLVKLRLTMTYYEDALKFIHLLEQGVPILVQLLASTNKAEVLESMEFFRVAHEYKIHGASDGVRAMIHLIWTKDNALVMEDGSQLKGIRSRLIEVYRSLYFDPYPGLSRSEHVALVCRNMIERTFGATLAELTSLEQLFSLMHAEGLVERAVVEKLWDVYASPLPISRAQRRGAIMILSMLAKAERELVAEKMDVLLRIGLGHVGSKDLVLAKHTCIALQHVSGSTKKVKGTLAGGHVRYPMQHPMFTRLCSIIETPSTDEKDRHSEWFGVAEQAIDAIYLLGEQPDALCTELLRHMTLAAFASTDQRTNDVYQMAQLVFVVGHVALKQMVHLELVEREFKRRKAMRDDVAQQNSGASKPATASELDQVAEQAEDDIGETMAWVRDRELLYGPESLLALYGNVVPFICSNTRQYPDIFLQRAAALTLCKFMCISAEYCEANLGLLLHLLRTSKDAVVRANAVIGLGDVAVCFGTLVDENSERLYAGLGDKDLGVKKNTLMVLTHLILNGMIKVKGQLGELAKCLEDEEMRVSDLAKLFFSELAAKENAVYNNLPDIISHLSTGEHAVDETTFMNTMRFIFTFIDKERQAENVIEKLCQRFRLTTQERSWRDIAFCLSLLPYRSERSIKKLVDALPFYRDKLYVPDVFQCFSEILGKMHQGKSSSAAAKASDTDLREFEDVLAHAASQSTQDHALEDATQTQTAKLERRHARPLVSKGQPSRPARTTRQTRRRVT